MKRKVILPLLFLFLVSSGVSGREYNEENTLKVVWVIIDQLRLDELNSAYTPNIDYLQKKGAFSLLNPRTVGNLESESTYLSINAGKESQGSKISQIGKVAGSGAVNDRIGELIELNKDTNYRAEPGLLGELARENNIRIGILGNCDIDSEEIRTIVSVAMDKNGYVPLAKIDKGILEKSPHPWEYQTDFSELKKNFSELKNKIEAVFIETGDISRIEHYYKNKKDYDKLSESCLLSDKSDKDSKYIAKINAIEKIDKFIGFLLKNLDLEETQVGLISPTPPRDAVKEGNRLSWVLFSGIDIEHGWLTSTTTRRQGVITIKDILPFFLKANSIEKNEGSYFSEVSIIPAKTDINWDNLISINKELNLIYKIRSPFIKVFILLQIIAIFAAIIKLVCRKSDQIIIFTRFSEYLLLTLLLVPVNCLILAFFQVHSTGHFVLLFLIFLFLSEIFLIQFTKDRLLHLLLISWVIVILCFFDLWNDYKLLADSLLGYSSVIGARYYGMGNEYMGFYLGAFLLALTVSLEKLKMKVKVKTIYLLPLFIVIIYSIGGVNLGANFGGMITAVVSIVVTYYYLGNYSKGLLIISALGLFFLIILVDYTGILGTSSHIGKAVRYIINGDWLWLRDTISRKFAVNIRLLRWTIWTRVLLAMMVYLLLLVKKPGPGLKLFFQEYPYLKTGIYGTLAGSIITIFVNDSGVVAAATLLFYPVMSLLYLYNQPGIKK